MKKKLTEKIEIRCTPEEKNTLKMLAEMYSSGNLSAYVMDRALHASRKLIKTKDFEFSERRIKKKRGHFGPQPGYEGKILDGSFQPGRRADAATGDKLKVIAENPLEAAIRHGQRTGRCACCGRELTKHSSIDRGIGPICAEKWGFG